MNKMLRKLLIVGMLPFALNLAACGNTIDNGASEYVVNSEDGKYQLVIDGVGTALVKEAGKDEVLLEGFVKLREENSAMTLSFSEEIVDVKDTTLHYKFELGEQFPIQTSFKIHRGQLMKGLDTNGVIYHACYDETGVDTIGMRGVGLLVWNHKIDVRVMKIQCNWSWSYSVDEGLKVWTNDAQGSFSTVEVAGKEGDNWNINYDLYNCKLPPFGISKVGTTTLSDTAIRNALGLN